MSNTTARDLIIAIYESEPALDTITKRVTDFINPDHKMAVPSNQAAVDILIEACYRAQLLEYTIEDAEACVRMLTEGNTRYAKLPIDRNDYVAIAENYLADYDADRSENRQMTEVCISYLDDLIDNGYAD